MRGQRYIGGLLLLLLCVLCSCRSAGAPAATVAVPTASATTVPPSPILTRAAPITPGRPSAGAAATRAGASPGTAPAPVGFQPPFPPPASCPVTPWRAFERRRGFPAFWLDGDGMAAGVPVGAVLYEGAQKVQWQAEPGGDRALSVTGERLDGQAPAARAENPVLIGVGTWSSSTVFPAPGCWHLRGGDGVHTLAATVYVYPAACRPAAIGGLPSTPVPCRPPSP